MMDDTLLELGITPHCDGKADYSGKESLTVNVINDDKRRIRGCLSGYPGTTHNNTVGQNIVQCQHPQDFVLQSEYLVADTAYKPSDQVIMLSKTVQA
ncbi:LOW QUALITY PROTEIN: hypothetical protein ACHAWX_001855 [Stephanocyclus meneghinianus]